MSGILRLESLTKGNTLKQGDKTPLKYRLFDADGEKLNIAGKSAKVRLVYPDFLTIGYEKDGLTVAQDDTVTFTIDTIIPSRIYHVEVIVDDQFIFPSRSDESKFTVDKSSLGTEANIIEIVGVDAVVRKAVDLINDDPSLIIDEDKLVGDIISNTGIGNINEYYKAFNDLKPRAELSISQSAEALTKSQNALNVANGIDAKANNALSLSESADTLSKSVQEQFNQVVIDGDSSVEAAQARVDASGQTNPSLKARLDKEHNEVTAQLAQKATQTDFNANDYGADPSASWSVNRDAFQAANDAAAVNGGGRVVAKAGLYEVKGIIQDSNVEFDLSGVTFKNPDGISPHVISSRTHEVNGSVNKGILTVDDTSHFSKGSSIIINHAGGILDTQFSSLSNDINSTTTTISLSGTDNRFPISGYMQVGNELISYTSMTGTTLNGVKRGQLGTSAQNHSAGDFIGVARHFYTEVTDIDGSNLILSEEVPLSVSDTLITVGAINPVIRNLTIDGNKIPTGHSSSVYGINWSTVRWGVIEDIVIKNGDMGGLMFSQGTTESIVNNITLIDCGVWESTAPKGAGMWLFHGSRRNKIGNINIVGKGWTGIYIDDRTTIASPYDAPSNDNYITNFIIDLIRPAVGYPPAFSIVGSNRNKFINGYAKGTATGVEIAHSGQYFTDDDSLAPTRDNEVAGVHFDVGQPWILRSTGNRIHDCTYSSKATSVPIVTEGNLAYAVTTTAGNPIEKLFDNLRFNNGTASNPSISFVNQPSTGFYNDGTTPMRLSVGGNLKYSFYDSEFRLQPGVDIATGSDVGTKIPRFASQKLGFFGKTPISQPPALNNLPQDATLQQLRDATQLIIVTLRNLGLISST